jgi:hypothetical protein
MYGSPSASWFSMHRNRTLGKIGHFENPGRSPCDCQWTRCADLDLSTDYQQPIRVSGTFIELKEKLKDAPVDTVEKTFDR